MDNAVEALKIAFAVMMFVMALGLSISSFSQARSAASSIINMSDRENEYTYIEPSDTLLTRTVGIETIIPTMYRAYTENIEIYFFKDNAGSPFYLYNKIDANGDKVIGADGNNVMVNYIDLSLENFSSAKDAMKHLDVLLSGDAIETKDLNKKKYTNGLYNELKDKRFTETLGEYYQGTGSTKIKKRVITYTMQW